MNNLPNLVVSACAGSGKTYALTERLMQLLKGGAAPGEILAITFTRKAAQEMHDRLLLRLQESDEPWAKLCQRRLLLAESENDKLNITTFHGWFGMLLAGHRWSPGWYGPADLCEDDAPLRAAAWHRWQKKTAAQDVAAILAECSPYSLQELLTRDLAHHYCAWLLRPAPPQPDETASAQELHAALQHFAAAPAVTGKEYANAQQAAQDYADAPSVTTLQESEKAFFTNSGSVRQRLLKAAAKGSSEAVLLDALDALKNHLNTVALAQAVVFHNALCTLAQGYLDELAAVKAETHQMSFNDLEYESYQAAMENGDVNAMLYRIHRRFRHILIDEFQDTSPLQWQVIVRWLRAAHGSEDAPSLFVVGDKKQAIYRFRYGDARLFAAAREFLITHYRSEEQESNTCYRLAPPLLNFINALFPRRWEDFPKHEVSDKTRHLRGRVEWHDFAPTPAAPAPARCLRNPLHTARPDDDRRRQWAQAVATKTKQIIGNWRIEKEGETRPATAEDILLLLPTTTHSAPLCRALQQQGLAVSRQGGQIAPSLVSRDIIALLTALLSPENRLSLAQTLRSPLFALPEETLMQLADGNLWENLRCSTDAAVEAAAQKLSRWRGWVRAGTLPVHDLLERIFAEGEVRTRYRAAVPPPLRQQVDADLSALLDCSLGQDGGRQPLLWQFLQAAPARATGGSSGVRLMTIHAAKGLESPIVILADCNLDSRSSGGNKNSIQLLVEWPPEAETPQTFFFRRAQDKRVYAEAVQNEKDMEESEYDNKFYVALTRAQQALVIFSFGKEEKEDGGRARENSRVAALRETMEQLAQQEDGVWVLGDNLSAAAAAATATAPAAAPLPAVAPCTPTAGEVVSGAARRQAGEVLHQQVALLLRGYDEATITAVTGASPTAAQHLLHNDRLQTLLQDSTRYEVEAEFVNAGKLLRVDLLICHAQEIWIIDYKSGDGALARYREQMDAYLATVSAAYPDKAVHGAFVTPRGFYRADEI